MREPLRLYITVVLIFDLKNGSCIQRVERLIICFSYVENCFFLPCVRVRAIYFVCVMVEVFSFGSYRIKCEDSLFPGFSLTGVLGL